ncbi:MAG: hypothetical protein ACXWK3_02705 [Reyranella sp.]
MVSIKDIETKTRQSARGRIDTLSNGRHAASQLRRAYPQPIEMEDATTRRGPARNDDKIIGTRGAAFLRRFDGIAFRFTWNSYAILPTYGATNLMKVSPGDLHARSR